MRAMFFAYGELTALSWGIIGSILMFVVQFVLCLKAKRKVIKCIPLYIIGCSFLFGAATALGLFGSSSAGAISGNGIIGLFIIGIAAIASVGELFAWLIYWITVLRKRKRTQ